MPKYSFGEDPRLGRMVQQQLRSAPRPLRAIAVAKTIGWERAVDFNDVQAKIVVAFMLACRKLRFDVLGADPIREADERSEAASEHRMRLDILGQSVDEAVRAERRLNMSGLRVVVHPGIAADGTPLHADLIVAAI